MVLSVLSQRTAPAMRIQTYLVNRALPGYFGVATSQGCCIPRWNLNMEA